MQAIVNHLFPAAGRVSVSSPVAMRMTLTALPITSAGRFSPLGPVGMGIFQRNDPLLKLVNLVPELFFSTHRDVFAVTRDGRFRVPS